MRRITKTIEITYREFEVGDLVSPSSRSYLPLGIYTVTQFSHPTLPYETDGTVFLDGKRFGYSTEYLYLVDEEGKRAE